MTVETPRDRRRAHPPRAAARAGRADRHCARLRHEVPAARRRLRKDAGDGRGRRDRAPRTHRTASMPVMMRTKPPFRADHVGSLLRSAPLKEARAKREKRRDHGGAAQGDRGSRDRGDHQEAGSGRAASRSPTANTAARSGTTTSSASSTASRPISASARSAFQGVQPKPMMLRVTGKLGGYSAASDDRAFQVRAVAHQGRRRR